LRAHAFDLKTGNLTDFNWSSFCGYMRPAKRPGFLTAKRVLESHGFADDTSGRSRYRNYMKRRILGIMNSSDPKEANEQWDKIRRGWAFGSDEFRMKIQDSLDAVVSGKRRDSFMGEEILKHNEKEAERLLQQGLVCCGITEEELPELKKGDDRKKVIAWRIRKKTSVRTEWITTRLKMGVTSNFSCHVRAAEQSTEGLLWTLKNKITN